MCESIFVVPRLFPKRQVLPLTGATETQLSRWAQDGIIRPSAGGGAYGADRRYSLSNLVEIGICRRLHRLGVGGGVMRWLIAGGPSGEDGALWIAAGKYWNRGRPVPTRPVLWVTLDHEDLDASPETRPTVTLTDDEFSFADRFGIAIGVAEIIDTLATRLGASYTDIFEPVFGDPNAEPLPPLVSDEALAMALYVLDRSAKKRAKAG